MPNEGAALRHELQLLDREAFCELSLHEKNAYLQTTVREIQTVSARRCIPLDRDQLSRLRRFYSRRSIADLKLGTEDRDKGETALLIYAEAIRRGAVEIAPEPRPATETANGSPVSAGAETVDDAAHFFLPALNASGVRDELDLMDIAPFTLSKMVRDRILRYELEDSVVTIEGGSEVGLATAYDYDIFIHMVSHLAAEMQAVEEARSRGLEMPLPARIYRPSLGDLLKFCQRASGGKQYLELENALDRLQATRIKITNLQDTDRRETESFPLIGRFRVVSRTRQNRVERVEIEIPGWVYDGVTAAGDKQSVLALNPAYFLITRPLAKFVYRLAVKSAGEGTAIHGLEDVHRRSGSSLPFRKFRSVIEGLVEECRTQPLPDYDLRLEPASEPQILILQKRRTATVDITVTVSCQNAVHHSGNP
ncbi:replication initiator protein A [Fulvimarina endophytica]|uniref:replication initiator protein A n=1 Tax=Fulvimarina endophytica TaxID=2293836 RepID=UPI001314C909|nr:replication initiator protein A [Fulvimarina endophytica]